MSDSASVGRALITKSTLIHITTFNRRHVMEMRLLPCWPGSRSHLYQDAVFERAALHGRTGNSTVPQVTARDGIIIVGRYGTVLIFRALLIIAGHLYRLVSSLPSWHVVRGWCQRLNMKNLLKVGYVCGAEIRVACGTWLPGLLSCQHQNG